MKLLTCSAQYSAVFSVLTALNLLTAVNAAADDAKAAKALLDKSGVQGGIVVHLGCGEGQLTQHLAPSGRYLVHGLDRDAANVAAARDAIRAAGKYGQVSIERLTGTQLPYADNLVNLLIVDEPSEIPAAEINRVLRPGGIAIHRSHGDPATSADGMTVKPWPENAEAAPESAALRTVLGVAVTLCLRKRDAASRLACEPAAGSP